MVQVLYNLIGNALKFTPRSGQIHISASPTGSTALIAVHDTGPGIAPEVMPRLFQRYAQAPDTARRGRGLGLFISRAIVEAHGGAIWADPQAKRGARFCFTLPLARPVDAPSLSAEMSMSEKPTERNRWKGDAVAESPPGQSEAAADRAAGREPSTHPREAPPPDPGRYQPKKSTPEDDREIQAEKQQEAVEQHAEDRANGTGTAPKNL